MNMEWPAHYIRSLWPFLEFNDLNSAIRSDYLGPPAQSCSRGVAPFAHLEFDSIITFHENWLDGWHAMVQDIMVTNSFLWTNSSPDPKGSHSDASFCTTFRTWCTFYDVEPTMIMHSSLPFSRTSSPASCLWNLQCKWSVTLAPSNTKSTTV